MIATHILNSRTSWNRKPGWNRDCVLNHLIESRNIFNVRTLDYDLTAVCSMDLDPTGEFLLVGQSNGWVDLQGVLDPNLGVLDRYNQARMSPCNLHRVQWFPGTGTDQFFSLLDHHNLYLCDPSLLTRIIDRFPFTSKTNWSDWNPNDTKIIAVCANESQTRLVDIRSGSSVQTIVLGAQSGLSSHRPTRCLWPRSDTNCLIVGDNEGYLHIYDTRHSVRPQLLAGVECGQISGMSFTSDQGSIITSHGTGNRLVQWVYDRCRLLSFPEKFKKRPKIREDTMEATSMGESVKTEANKPATSSTNLKKVPDKKKRSSSSSRQIISLPVDAYLRCQFYVTDRHVYCPVPAQARKSKELYIYDLESGYRIKTLKSENIMSRGTYSVTGLLPESLVLFVGGREKLRTWTVDEDYQRKMEEKIRKYHTTNWDSGDEDNDRAENTTRSFR